jgi:hypothetical protein
MHAYIHTYLPYPADIEVVVLDAVSVFINLTTFLKFIRAPTYTYIHTYIHTYQTDRLLVNDCLVVCECDQAHRNLSIVGFVARSILQDVLRPPRDDGIRLRC